MSSLVKTFLHEHMIMSVQVSELVLISFPNHPSRIIQSNNDMLYACVFTGLEGLFRKDRDHTRSYGRALCDRVKELFDCDGFFTSDELPRYGIQERDIKRLNTILHKKPHDGRLIVLFGYPKPLAEEIRQFLIQYFQQEAKDQDSCGR